MHVVQALSVVALTFISSMPGRQQAAPTAKPVAQWKHPGVLSLEIGGDFEGDILLPRNRSTDRNAVTKKDELWPKGIIPYVIDAQLNRTTKKILKTMADIESETCLRFVARRNQKNYVLITRREGCSSFVGRQGGVQEVSLGTHCLYTGLIAHELLHAVGFDHEHSRSDRDEYIDVFMENVEPENTEQFEKLAPSKNRLLTPFDMDSIMLYGSETFAREPGLVTMLAKNGSHLKDVFEKPGLSASDVLRINLLYNCKNKKK
ncbi:astacin-like metalloprotease toxin 5 [Rhipicephalus microplus]|uniref:astacin-like metalloprotease toxin 5 n=1 Tax=Rhipicephalus microplus TaxID=6941 RepID=UPI002F2B10BA